MKKISRIIKNEEDKQITIIFYDYEMLEIRIIKNFSIIVINLLLTKLFYQIMKFGIIIK